MLDHYVGLALKGLKHIASNTKEIYIKLVVGQRRKLKHELSTLEYANILRIKRINEQK